MIQQRPGAVDAAGNLSDGAPDTVFLMPRIAIIGSGISGLGTAWFLHRDYKLTAGSGERCEPGLTLVAVSTAVP
jgi:hypothetical protein